MQYMGLLMGCVNSVLGGECLYLSGYDLTYCWMICNVIVHSLADKLMDRELFQKLTNAIHRLTHVCGYERTWRDFIALAYVF
jgi:recombinational DNA repair protein (RecF pathway)